MKSLGFWISIGAEESLHDALAGVAKKRAVSLRASLEAVIQRKLNGVPLASGTWEDEGSLPQSAGRFFAIKKIPLRCYCWVEDGTLCISHYTYKKRQKLSTGDIDRVERSWFERRTHVNERKE